MDQEPLWVSFHSPETCGICERCAYIKQRQEIGALPGRRLRIWGSAVWMVLLLAGFLLFADLPQATGPQAEGVRASAHVAP